MKKNETICRLNPKIGTKMEMHTTDTEQERQGAENYALDWNLTEKRKRGRLTNTWPRTIHDEVDMKRT